MREIVSIILLSLFSNMALADCDFSTGIVPGPNNTYIYSEACHKKVGQLVQDNNIKDAQIADLNKAITLKDLAITTADQRTQLWMDTSFKLEDRLNAVDSVYKRNEWLYFALGVVVTSAAVYGAAHLAR